MSFISDVFVCRHFSSLLETCIMYVTLFSRFLLHFVKVFFIDTPTFPPQRGVFWGISYYFRHFFTLFLCIILKCA